VKQTLKFISLLLLVALIASGCSTKAKEEDLYQFKGTYVGDNSAIGNIVNQLQGAEYLKGFELKSKEKPYGIILNYGGSEPEQSYKITAVYNATFLFTLVQNADWITFNFGSQEYTITEENLQNWYEEDFRELKNEEELKTFIKKHLGDEEKVNQLFR